MSRGIHVANAFIRADAVDLDSSVDLIQRVQRRAQELLGGDGIQLLKSFVGSGGVGEVGRSGGVLVAVLARRAIFSGTRR
jgi:hypothetical protein